MKEKDEEILQVVDKSGGWLSSCGSSIIHTCPNVKSTMIQLLIGRIHICDSPKYLIHINLLQTLTTVCINRTSELLASQFYSGWKVSKSFVLMIVDLKT